MPRSRRNAGLLIAALVLASACASEAPRAGVNVKTITTDLVFGIPPSPVPVAPPNTALLPDDPLPVELIGPASKPRTTPAPLPDSACPAAGANAFPEEPAISVVEKPPLPGIYKWIVKGAQQVPTIGPVPLPQMVKREVVGGERLGPDRFTFTTIEDELVFGSQAVVEQTFEVRNSAPGPGQDAGIFLTKIVQRVGQSSAVFQPSPPIEFAPIPIEASNPPLIGGADPRAGDQIDSVGVDGTTLQALRHRGNITRRNRVDACGKVIDAWFVEAEQTFVSPTGEQSQRRYDYAIASQFGGLIVAEHVEAPCEARDDADACTPAPTLTYDARIGQIEPSKT